MRTSEIIEKLKGVNRAEVARATGLPYMYLSRLAWDVIKNPGAKQVDILREYFTNESPPPALTPRGPSPG